MAPEEVASKSRAIRERLERIPAFAEARALLCYVSSKDNEVDTHALIASLLKEDRTVLVPIAESDGRLAWSERRSLDELAPSRFGIFEPRPETRRIVSPPADALVLVPGVAFTRDGRRIGYGGGYFDRFLATYQGLCVGVAFELQIIDDFPSSAHDIPVACVLTESNIYSASTD